MYEHMHVTQRTIYKSQLPLSTLWVLGLKFKVVSYAALELLEVEGYILYIHINIFNAYKLDDMLRSNFILIFHSFNREFFS